MGWEDRNGRSYYYRKERVGNTVRSVYVGSGEQSKLISQFDALLKDEREGQRALKRIEREQWEKHNAELDRLCAHIEKLTTGALLVAGFHIHKRQWRRIRDEREHHNTDRRRED